jgi:hypothetical protein
MAVPDTPGEEPLTGASSGDDGSTVTSEDDDDEDFGKLVDPEKDKYSEALSDDGDDSDLFGPDEPPPSRRG